MRLDRVVLVTATRTYDFDLQASCTVLDGPVGTGKSSLLELIKYGLGGGAVLTPVVRQEVSEVRLAVRFGPALVWLRRRFDRRRNFVDVVDPSGESRLSLPVRTAQGEETISDFLLERLEIPKVRIPRSRANAGSATVPLTFGDLFVYLYVPQQDIDRSIAGHTETFREPKRRAMFELLFGLTDERQLYLETRIGELRDEIRRTDGRVASIRSFLDAAKIADPLILEQKLIELRNTETSAEAELAKIRSAVKTQTQAHEGLMGEVRQIEYALNSATVRYRETAESVQAREQLLAQMHIDFDRGQKSVTASLQLAPLDFVSCPRCLQDLPDERTDGNHCRLCLQGTPTPVELHYPADMDDARVDELQDLVRDAHMQLELVGSEVERLRSRLEHRRGLLDQVTADAVTPRFSEIELLSARGARAAAEAESTMSVLAFWRELAGLEAEVATLGQERIEAEQELAELKRTLVQRREILSTLSEVFEATVRYLEVPWAQSAKIDERTYLPVVNGEDFESLAVAGGTKTVVTVAYHLSLLSVALSHADVLLPGLLIIDTPRKNLGFNNLDSALGGRIYQRIRTLVDAYAPGVQFIVADNDVPRDPSWITVRHLDYDHPLIEHVAHPGEEAALSGALPTVGTLAQT